MSLNYKLIHRQAKNFMCKDCLADYFEISVSDLYSAAVRYKKEGCMMFSFAENELEILLKT